MVSANVVFCLCKIMRQDMRLSTHHAMAFDVKLVLKKVRTSLKTA